jgi:hypothetical protein
MPLYYFVDDGETNAGEFREILVDALRDNFTYSDYNRTLNELYGSITIMGITYDANKLFNELDNDYYHEKYEDMFDDMVSEAIYETEHGEERTISGITFKVTNRHPDEDQDEVNLYDDEE